MTDAMVRASRPSQTSPPGAGGALLNRALSKAGLGHHLRVAFAQFPQARVIAERLAWYLTDRVPLPVNFSRTLLPHCLTYAYLQLERAQRQTLDPVSIEVRNAFVSGLYWHTPMMVEIETVSAKGALWDPFAGQPLGDWMVRHGEPGFRLIAPSDEHVAVGPRTMRAAVANATMTPEDMATLGMSLEALAAFEVN